MSVYLNSKVIHRWLVGLLSILGLIMVVTGLILEEQDTATVLGIDIGLIKELHTEFGVYFAYLFLAMMATGLVLYFFPYYQKRKVVKTGEKSSESTTQT